MLHPEIHEPNPKPLNKVEEDLYASKSGPTAAVIAYVSKMFAVSKKDLPENKKKPLTAEELRAKAREAKESKEAAADGATPAPEKPPTSEATPADGFSDSTRPDEALAADGEVVLGFARLYSGTIRVGASVYAVLPKYKTSLGPTHPSNAKYLLTSTVEGLYVMMGRELVPAPQVVAGNIFAIKGLESKVWRSATLCSPEELGIGENPNAEEHKDSIINLGSVNLAVSVAYIRPFNFSFSINQGCTHRPCCTGTRKTRRYAETG